MREIEIKARVRNKLVLLEKLKTQNIIIGDPVTQRDQVFGLPGEDGGNNKPVPWLRIRTEIKGDKTTHFFTLKKSITNQMDSIEHETEITDGGEMAKIIEHLNFVPYSDSTKTRAKAHVGDVELCIDTVDGLGDFIEAEKLTEETADYDTIAKELWDVLESLGVGPGDHVTDGYDVMMRRKLDK